MKYLIPSAVTVEINIPAKKASDSATNFVVNIELVVQANNEKEALRKASEHIEKKLLKSIKLSLKNYSLSRKPIPLNKPPD